MLMEMDMSATPPLKPTRWNVHKKVGNRARWRGLQGPEEHHACNRGIGETMDGGREGWFPEMTVSIGLFSH